MSARLTDNPLNGQGRETDIRASTSTTALSKRRRILGGLTARPNECDGDISTIRLFLGGQGNKAVMTPNTLPGIMAIMVVAVAVRGFRQVYNPTISGNRIRVTSVAGREFWMPLWWRAFTYDGDPLF